MSDVLVQRSSLVLNVNVLLDLSMVVHWLLDDDLLTSSQWTLSVVWV